MNCLKLKAISFAFSLAAGLPVCAEAMQWPDTAQTLCYDNTKEIPCPTDENSPFYGQDAQYQGTARSYTKLGQGGVELPDDATEWIMVRDNVTGLTWEMKNNLDDTPDYTNPHDADNRYYWCDKSYIWYGHCEEEFNTEKFITSVNTEKFGGFSDWRMPTVEELSSLFYSGLSPYVDWIYLKPVKAYYPYWSSSLAADHNYSWYVHFGDKDNIYYSNLVGMKNSNTWPTYSDESLYARAVRGGK